MYDFFFNNKIICSFCSDNTNGGICLGLLGDSMQALSGLVRILTYVKM